MSATKKPTRYWRYEITEVWGEMEGRIEVGAVIIDRWKNPSVWYTMNFKSGKDGGWAAKRLGEVTEPDALAQIAANRPRPYQEWDRANPSTGEGTE